MKKPFNARRKLGWLDAKKKPDDRTEFSGKVFQAILKDMQDKTIPLSRVLLTDPDEVGLRVIIRSAGTIAFHVSYTVDGSTPLLKIGSYPDMSIDEARELTRTIRYLASQGIDPQVGLHERLIRELKEKGTKWRP
jgi:hypothetical protein